MPGITLEGPLQLVDDALGLGSLGAGGLGNHENLLYSEYRLDCRET